MTVTLLTREGALSLPAQPGQTLLEVLRAREGLSPHAPCGGKGTCEKCQAFLREANCERSILLCRTEAKEGMVLRLPEKAALSVEGLEPEGSLLFPPDPNLSGHGISCDIGTTTVVCRLVDLSTGRSIAALGEGNAQRPFGDDVITRINASMEGQQGALTSAIRGQLSRMIETLCTNAGLTPAAIARMAVAANTTMCHLLVGLAPDSMGRAPFTPLSRFGEVWEAKDLDLPFEGPVYIAPAISAYVGGDVTADLLSVPGWEKTSTLLVDVGTNGEMALLYRDRSLCCSTAAGPAFEGAQIRCGMTAAPGAITAVRWEDGALRCNVLGGGTAVGLCGSGLIDAVAVMLDLGALDETGRIQDPEEDKVPPAALPYLIDLEGEAAFRLTEQVWVTQADVRKLQLGKGAIAAGIQILRDAAGDRFPPIGALLLAGGFGSSIRPESAARIGLIPADLLPLTRGIGNAAIRGAREALCSRWARERLMLLQDEAEHLELSGLPAFNDAYLEAMLFPEED